MTAMDTRKKRDGNNAATKCSPKTASRNSGPGPTITDGNAAGKSRSENSRSGPDLPPPIPAHLPKVAFLGRPNVGKSTLFNRLIHSNRAITHDMPGVTRDRMEGVSRRAGERPFVLIDTGGITLDAHASPAEGPEGIRGFEAEILRQAEEAIADSVELCLVVDGREGLTPFDEHLAAYLRRSSKPVLLVVNKVDGPEQAAAMTADFFSLGLPPLPVSAAHGFNMYELEEAIRSRLPPAEEKTAEAAGEPPSLRLALLGKPNVGKSSLVNALTGQTRMIVSDVAGTTRDSIDVSTEINGVVYTFVDTAGVRRPARVTRTVEQYSVNSSLKSSSKAHVTLLVLDGPEGLTQQDKRLIELLRERMTPFMVLVNKSDLIPAAALKSLEKKFREELTFCPHVPLLFISALRGGGLKKILPLAWSVHRECGKRIGTGELNRTFVQILARHQPPLVKGARVKFYYLTQAEVEPPTFVFFVNDAARVLPSYVRYIEKSLRMAFGISHAPLRVRFRSTHTDRKK